MNPLPFDIIDIEFIAPIESLADGWGLWECTATLEDGSQIAGVIQGDGVMAWASDTFEAQDW